MAARLLVSVLTIAVASTVVCGLQCYFCVRENQPQGGADKYCAVPSPTEHGNNTVENCSEQCTIVKDTSKEGLVTTFRRSCGSNNTCSRVKGCTPFNAEGTVRCTSCCNTDFCNKDDVIPTSGTQHSSGSLYIFSTCSVFVWAVSMLQ